MEWLELTMSQTSGAFRVGQQEEASQAGRTVSQLPLASSSHSRSCFYFLCSSEPLSLKALLSSSPYSHAKCISSYTFNHFLIDELFDDHNFENVMFDGCVSVSGRFPWWHCIKKMSTTPFDYEYPTDGYTPVGPCNRDSDNLLGSHLSYVLYFMFFFSLSGNMLVLVIIHRWVVEQ